MPNTSTPTQLTKTIGMPLRKGFSKTEKNTLIVRGFFTSDAPDMHGDIISRGATEGALPAYRTWRNIRRMHEPNPVGKARAIGEEEGLEWNEVEIEVIDPKTIYEVENGLLQALSVGILINFEDITWLESGGMYISAYILGEISLVDHPANYDSYLRDNSSGVDTAVQILVRQYGLDAMSQSVLKVLDVEENSTNSEENTMTDQTNELPVEAAVEEIVVENDITDTATAEDVVVEEEPVVEAELSVEDTDASPSVESVDENPVAEVEDVETTIEASVDAEPASIDKRLNNIERMLELLLNKDIAPATVEEESTSEDPDTGEADASDTEPDVAIDAHRAIVPASDDTEVAIDAGITDAPRTLRRALEARFNINN